ncbi:type II toxin-antitoxin system RelE/ParE family toxin, partial [Escherichia coli]|uniref:type II toxin-antitoxin system RelE/ParE family toxin n=1 Tax=Escherichia coli TaxID=562 RepID=UPI0034D97174
KGLRKFAETGNNAGIPQQFTQRLKLILTALSTATNLQDMMDLKALRCHPLKGDREPRQPGGCKSWCGRI